MQGLGQVSDLIWRGASARFLPNCAGGPAQAPKHAPENSTGIDLAQMETGAQFRPVSLQRVPMRRVRPPRQLSALRQKADEWPLILRPYPLNGTWWDG